MNGRLAACGMLLLMCGGCAAVIVPPPKSASAVPVLVADYGYHSTVIFPASDGALMEYGYGDWTFMANNHKSLATTLEALFVSEQATLGRRSLMPATRPSDIEKLTGAVTVLRLEAPREKVLELERDLERRFSARLDSIMYSDWHKLYFVKDDERYSALHNCNHLTAQWLEKLGCRIEGPVLSSKFRLKEEEPAK